jgi:hypothetical protein
MQRSINRRITAQDSPGIKRDPISKITNINWALVAHACNPSYIGGRDQKDESLKPALAEKTHHKKKKGPWSGSSSKVTCLASARA